MRRFVGQAGSLGGKGKDPRICSKKKKKGRRSTLKWWQQWLCHRIFVLAHWTLAELLALAWRTGTCHPARQNADKSGTRLFVLFQGRGGGGQAGQDGENGKKRMIFDHM